MPGHLMRPKILSFYQAGAIAQPAWASVKAVAVAANELSLIHI